MGSSNHNQDKALAIGLIVGGTVLAFCACLWGGFVLALKYTPDEILGKMEATELVHEES